MKIVIYTHYLKGGGAEKRASVYANYFYEQGHDVYVLAMHKVDNEYYLNRDIKRYWLKESKEEYNKTSIFWRLKEIKRVFEEIDPDVIISFLTSYGAYAALAKRMSKKLSHSKTFYCVSLYQKKYSLLGKMVDRFACNLSDNVILQCKEQLGCNKKIKNKCIVSYNPINDKWDKNANRNYDSISAMAVGRLTDQKNFELAIKGIIKAHETNSNVTLDIYGQGPLEDKLNSLISENNASSYIKIHPFTPDLTKEYEKHNTLILSSKYEGFPNALGEAMMAGLTCLTTKCPTGPSEMIDNNENGLFFSTVDELKDSLLSLLDNKNKFKELGISARKKAKNSFEDKVTLSKLYEDINNLIKDSK